jgi:hypothetical protein
MRERSPQLDSGADSKTSRANDSQKDRFHGSRRRYWGFRGGLSRPFVVPA